MKAKSYVQRKDGDLVPLERVFKIACCDCGLVHLWELKKKMGELFFKVTRDARATAQRRRKK